MPLFPFNLLNYALGLTRIRFLSYLITTFICMLPGCIAFVVFSSSLVQLLRGKITPNLLLGIALIVALSVIPGWIRKTVQARRRKRESSGVAERN